jgi:hypothetical protein
MANITLTANCYWSTLGTGNGTPGSPPGTTDNIYLNGHSFTLDEIDGFTYICGSISGCASNGTTPAHGTIVILDGITTVNIGTVGTPTNIVAGLDRVIYPGANDDTTWSVVGNLSSLSGGIINWGGQVSFTLTGNLTAGSTASGVVLGNGGSFVVHGTVTGGSVGNVAGVAVNTSSCTVAVDRAVGGSAVGAHGVYALYGSSAGTVTVGVAKGGSVFGALGAAADVICTIILNGTDLTGVGYPAGTTSGYLKVAAGVLLQFSNSAGALLPFYSGVVSANYVLAGHDNYTGGSAGLVVLPGVSDVVSGVTFGTSSGLTGNVVLPSTSTVLSGTTFGPSSGSTGNVVLPATTSVLSTITFGPSNSLTGQVILPAAGDVRSGTPVGVPPAQGTLNASGTGQARVIGG